MRRRTPGASVVQSPNAPWPVSTASAGPFATRCCERTSVTRGVNVAPRVTMRRIAAKNVRRLIIFNLLPRFFHINPYYALPLRHPHNSRTCSRERTPTNGPGLRRNDAMSKQSPPPRVRLSSVSRGGGRHASTLGSIVSVSPVVPLGLPCIFALFT